MKRIIPYGFKNLTKNFTKIKNIFAITSLSLIAHYKYSSNNKSLFMEDEYVKMALSDYQNLENGQMREFKYGPGKEDSILIVKYEGKLRALGNYCTHFGAPMHTGVLIDRVVKCPWHGASFDVVTGRADISPGLNDLNTFEIVEENGTFYVKLPKNLNDVKKTRVPEMVKKDPENKKRFVIVGGGAAGLSAAETLRQAGFTGEVALISDETSLPYDRTMLTKWVPDKVDNLYLRGKEFFDEYGIDVMLNTKVTNINNKEKSVTLNDGKTLTYDKLLYATGSSPIYPEIEVNGNSDIKSLSDIQNLHVIRTYSDASNYVKASKENSNILVVGGGFISMEAASNIKKTNKNANVTVLTRSKQPFVKELGAEVGESLKMLHEGNGVKFIGEKQIKSVSLSGSKVNSITLNDGTKLSCDMILFGTGTKPNTELLKNVVQMENNHIKSNLFLATSDPNIFCAGDVASVPFIHSGKRYSYGHWVNAQQQGAIGALNMLDKNVPFDYVPYYWTRMWDKTLQFTGNGSDFDEVFVDGDLSKHTFSAFYSKNGKVVGFASMGVPNATNIMYEGFKSNLVPKVSLFKDGTLTLDDMQKTLNQVKNKCSRSTCACAAKQLKI